MSSHMGTAGFSAEGQGLASVLRGVVAAAVLLSAVVHLELWAEGFNQLAVVGPAFLLNAIGGFVIGLAVLVWRHWIPVVLAIGFGLATLGAFVVSVTVGLFGLHEVLYGVPQTTAGIAEIVAVVFGLAVLLLERRTSVDGDHARGLDRRPGAGSAAATPTPPASRSAAP
ncbi:MAG TPA: hypothetical protein VFX33_05515 [Actinomycetales bacterium]|nr:hypothetical protein [Actinomycetales bacterium]